MTSPEDGACTREPFDARARAKAIAPFVEEETAFVVHVDLSRIALQPTFDLFCQVLPEAHVDFRNGAVAKKLGEILNAGVNEFYAVAPLTGMWTPLRSCYIIPLPQGADEKAVRAVFQIPDGMGLLIEDALVLLVPRPSSQTEEPQREFRPMDRPELTATFEAAGDTAAQVVFIPPAYTRRVIEEFMPQMPDNLGNGPSTVLTRGVSWAAVGINSPPQGSLQLVIQSADARAADALRVKLADLLRLAGGYTRLREAFPKYDDVAAMLAPTVEGDHLVLALDEQNQGFENLVAALTLPSEVMQARRLQRQMTENLKSIVLAMVNYEGVNGHFPLLASASPDGKPLLSWRVAILPYQEYVFLYEQFHLDEPWDSPHNRTLIDKMPQEYRHPLSKAEIGRTNYLLPVGNGAAFSADKPTEFKDITDGCSHTIMVVEVDDQHAAIWTKPDDWAFDPADPTRGLGRFFGSGFNAAFFDGAAQTLPWPQTPQEFGRLHALITCADGEVVTR